MKRLSLTQVRVLLIIGAVLLIALTYFVIYQPNMNSAADYDIKKQEADKKIQELKAMETENADLEVFTSLYRDDMDELIASFPVKLTQQKSLYLIYRMLTDTGIDVTTVTPNAIVPFYYKGAVLSDSGSQEQALQDSKEDQISELNTVPMSEMIGSSSKYEVGVTGTYKQVVDTLQWITSSEERLSVDDVALQYDNTTGKLTGSIGVDFYAMLGNGNVYKEPKVSDFSFGMKNAFGAKK